MLKKHKKTAADSLGQPCPVTAALTYKGRTRASFLADSSHLAQEQEGSSFLDFDDERYSHTGPLDSAYLGDFTIEFDDDGEPSFHPIY